ncbi:phenylalanine--tRNA ligase subunit beta [Candidatus Karelsulcia muelleri]|uniref:Phenylalanine--tRNA ligase beta subunit n=1 Tax=Candidatus Karelsulcia muelleri PSPU TaxID=1189303 RepID=A0AAD1B1V4_9FLAO|nr:phenylalanine--tRNA ligase subunit beta [Candidatus Karelsulcia muelleri]NJJ98787.1 phenylalanine--tRNA ligase subunit beta [Candidatus Karelsulcia muelleri]BAO66188.1 phenylalanyl-tRNA synthetase subunit beta [Candidatus Karelsulcia muelleri PSPU]
MKISYNCLKQYISTEVEIENICNILTDIGINVENFFSFKKDYLIELNLPPNRGDIISHYGIARDLNIALKFRGFKSKMRKLPSVFLFKKDFDIKNINFFIKNYKKCLRYTYTTICNINVFDSPKWLKNYLSNRGYNSINNLLDIEHFIMSELGQPIKIFDLDKIINFSLKIEKFKKKIKIDKKKILSEKNLILLNNKNTISLAGLLMNKYFIVNNKTKNIFIESADYSSEYIYKTAKKYHIKNDSSIRFERGIDTNFIIYALKRAALLIKKISGGKITSDVIDLSPQKKNNIEIFLRYKIIKYIIGYNINIKKIKKILFLLEIYILFENLNGLKIKIPFYRKDITREIDVIEEILRIYGYNNFIKKKKINQNYIINNNLKIENIISNQLNSHGFYETLNISLNKKRYRKYYSNNRYKKINILNSYNQNLSILRFSLLFGLLENISYNLNRNKNKIKLFEWGKKYLFLKKNIIENNTLGLIFYDEKKKDDNYNLFFKFKGIIEQIIRRCGMIIYHQNFYKNNFLENGLSFFYKKKIFCVIGYVKNKILIEFEIYKKILYADINWDIINIIINNNYYYKKIYKKKDNFNRDIRDISLLIDKNISFEEIKNISFSLEKENLKKIVLLDEYKSTNLPFGKKSYTLSFYFKKKTYKIENLIHNLKTEFKKKIKAKIR